MLFGHQNDDNKQTDNVINDVSAPAVPSVSTVNPLAVDPDTGVSLPAEPLEHNEGSEPHATVSSSSSHDDDDSAFDELLAEAATPAQSVVTHSAQPSDTATSSAAPDLLNLKQEALEQLGPLVDHLDQTPEEKFRITMMMIQSSDNDSLIKTAYEAAQAISDDKARAQALLDIINEINYFTQKQD